MTTILYVQGAAERAGAERILLTLLRHLDRDRFRPVVAFCARGPFIDEVAAAGAEVLELPPVGRLRDVTRFRSTVAALAEAIESVDADLVQATGEKMSAYAGWAARRTGRPCVFWLHDAPGTSAAAWLTQLSMAATPRAATVACAAWLAKSFSRRLRMRAQFVHNGIDVAELPKRWCARSAILADAGWDDDAVIFGHFARLERWKGTEEFLRAAATVAVRAPRVRFLVVGGTLYGREETHARRLPLLARELGLGSRVRFCGYRADALELMASADVVVHSSLRPDPFPMVVLEAMGLGVPIVATRTRGPEEAIAHVRTGLLVPPGDVDALAEAMSSLATNDVARRRLGAAARSTVMERFTADRMAARFGELYDTLVAPSIARIRR